MSDRVREPFDFVPYLDGSAIDYAEASGHDRLRGRSGRLECQLEALSPLLVMDSHHRASAERMNTGQFMQNQGGAFIIPGTSLKGMVRSLFEVIYPSCTAVHSRESQSLIPNAFRPCTERSRVCPACRVFGFLDRGTVHKGHVNIGTARAEDSPQPMAARQLIPLFTPSPNSKKYKSGGSAKGYKFYFHQTQVQESLSDNDQRYGSWVAPLPARTTFSFTVTFENLTDKELNALVAALVLADDVADPETGDTVSVRHKLGYGKPAGLGSINVALQKVILDPSARKAYQQFDRSQDVMVEGSEAFDEWVGARQQMFFGTPSESVQQLIRILRYPPREDVQFAYDQGAWGS